MSNARDVALYFLNLGANCPPLADVQAALALLNGGDAVGPAVPVFKVVDAENGLVEFAEFPGLRCSFEGAKSQFAPDSKAWNTININCGEAQFCQDNPNLGAMHIAVVPCIRTLAPGSNTNYYWHEDKDATAFANSRAIPNSNVKPEDAVAWLRTHVQGNAIGDGSGFGPK